MAYGEYTLEGEMNLTPFFEVLYVERDFFSNSGAGQLFPTVPARNPFNLCNPEAENGVDCGLAWDALMNNPNFLPASSPTIGSTATVASAFRHIVACRRHSVCSPAHWGHRLPDPSYPCAETANWSTSSKISFG